MLQDMKIQLGNQCTKYINNISEIADCYDAFLLDIWGVLHDSANVYPGVVDCLQHLKRSGKKIILISNAARRSVVLEKELTRFGLTHHMYDHVVTSGELFWNSYNSGKDTCLNQLGSKYYLIGSAEYDLTLGLPLNQVATIDAADFVLTISVVGSPVSIEEKVPILREAAERSLTMICVNPDLVVVRDGVLGIAAGVYAKKYEELGGQVRYYGKPYSPIYRYCFELLEEISREKTIAVGDALKTDIAGADGCSLDSILVGTGIHNAAVGNLPDDHSKLLQICQKERRYPTIVIQGLVW